ncbi:MAG: hypothetical protein MZV49_15415 [Rhodopseudomonas palustris]|nr:hypothetical protein [Rhodopseudomonas palustris]
MQACSIDPANISVHIQGLKVVENTMRDPHTFTEEDLHQALAEKEIAIQINVG